MGRKTAQRGVKSIATRRNGRQAQAGRAVGTGAKRQELADRRAASIPARRSSITGQGLPTASSVDGILAVGTASGHSALPRAAAVTDSEGPVASEFAPAATRSDGGTSIPAARVGGTAKGSPTSNAPATQLTSPAVRAPNRRGTTAVLDRVATPETLVVEPLDDVSPAQSRSATMRGPMLRARAIGAWSWLRSLTPETWVWIGILTLAAVLRYWGLGDKPLHHDESMHAFYSLQFGMDPASYEYDPLLHGPFQFHAEGFVFAIIIGLSQIFHVASASGNPWINDATARILPATTGLVLVGLTIGLRRPLGRIGAPIAALLLAISPTFVYFSRFLREDIYFACFTYATIIFAVQYAYKRTTRWLIATVIAFVLAYATKEAIYLNVAMWGGFLAILAAWEIGHAVTAALPREFTDRQRAFFGHAAPLLLLGAIGSGLAAIALHELNVISHAINANTPQTNIAVTHLENTTVAVILWASIALALLVIGVLIWQIYHDVMPEDDHDVVSSAAEITDLDGSSAPSGFARGLAAGLRARLDPERQPFLRLLLGTTWVNWFVAFVAGWVLFVGLYTVLPGPEHNISGFAQGFQVGVGRGIWQGLYYWIQQQQVARGGQPWYYYLLLMPLYEQLAVVFGLAGIVRCLVRPTRFRIFLVYWFVVSLALYSWAGEKMPWLSMHILLPLMVLAAVALEWLVVTVAAGVRALAQNGLPLAHMPWIERTRLAGGVLGLTVALVLLVPMTYGMVTLTHKDAANGPHEMMIYVQTTPDVQLAMAKINHADALMYGGKHQLRIAVDAGEVWPMYWYLRDYWLVPHPSEYVNFNYVVSPTPSNVVMPTEDVLMFTDEDAATFMAQHPTGYTEHTYSLRSWWDEGYKPLPCVSTRAQPCPQTAQWGSGVGLGNWLTYGDNVPLNGHFQLGPTVHRLWNWLWLRQSLGSDQGSYNFVLIVRNGVPIQP